MTSSDNNLTGKVLLAAVGVSGCFPFAAKMQSDESLLLKGKRNRDLIEKENCSWCEGVQATLLHQTNKIMN